MALSAGVRLGHYEIQEPLGVGGMGEVYRARDTKLNRDVAIKILPDAFASDADRVARFTREAQTLATLNHPHIAQIHGLEESFGVRALVMELVAGEDLAQRIARGPIPLDEALAIAKQIAEALEAAHEQGIIHRDLKPANIKLRADGAVKVLDFGLAKATLPDVDVANSPTFTVAATQLGVIVGTAAYMAPEQARGKPVDKRADIWAFGCVLYEMLTGGQAFGSETITDTLSAILTREPDWQALPVATPANVRRVLRLCLQKNPSRRLHHIAAAQALIDFAELPPEGPTTQGAAWRPILTAGGIVLAAAVAAFYGGHRTGMQQAPIGGPVAPLIRAAIELPAAAPLALGAQIPLVGFDAPVVALSPDGRRLAYVGQSPSGTMLYVRDIGGLTVRPLAGTEGAIYGFVSPDSRWLGFLTNDKVKKVSLDGGAPSTLCDATQPVNASWTRDGTIYFSEEQGVRLSRVSAAGGNATVVTVALPDGISFFSQILPDGKATLLTNWSRGISTDYADIVLVSLATGESKLLIRSGYDARYVPPNHLLFGRSGSLFAVRFNPTRGETEGEPFLAASGASMESFFGRVHAAASENGLIAHVPGSDRAVGRLAWVDREGRTEFLPPPARLDGAIDLSPDGERLAVHVADVRDYIWTYDLRRGEGRRLTAGEHRGWPAWSPDNRSVALSGWQAFGQFRILRQQVEGAGQAREIAGSVKISVRYPSSWSPDGRVLALTRWGATSFLSMDGTEARRAVANAMLAHFSPDGSWLAYTSSDTGRGEIFVQSYPDGKTVSQISVDGGGEPVWCQCGELFWRTGNRWMSVAIRTQPELSWDPPRLAFQTDFIDTFGRSYDVSPDGRRLLIVKRAEAEDRSRIYLVTNWMTDAEKIGLVDKNP